MCRFLKSSSCAAQAAGRGNAKQIQPPAGGINTPFNLNAPSSQRMNSMKFRPASSMAAQDRQAVASAMPVIGKSAALQGFNLGRGKWTYRQIVCPIFPNHLLLFFLRNRGVGDVSEFSAILSRTGKDAVRILPILRRSYTLPPPAPVNPLSIAAFNWLRSQDDPGKKVDWLTAGLCYAALTGTHVVLPAQVENNPKVDIPLAMNPLLQVAADGSAVVRFDDVEAPHRTEEWDLAFGIDGTLLHVAVTPMASLKVTPLP